ncbi:hypothetical protein MKEN_01161800 [Mycena kentingensis (nom. inval.)]|nr:hypothetical protein MKEN_01161800 [Mycena kentingensis (nom. inval.)]
MDDYDLDRVLEESRRFGEREARLRAKEQRDIERAIAESLGQPYYDVDAAASSSSSARTTLNRSSSSTMTATMTAKRMTRAEEELARFERHKHARAASPQPQPRIFGFASGSSTRQGATKYPDGKILRTLSAYATHNETPGISFCELVGNPQDTEFAIISAYVLDADWTLSFFEAKMPVVFVTDPRAPSEPPQKGKGKQKERDEQEKDGRPGQWGVPKKTTTQLLQHGKQTHRIVVIPGLQRYGFPIMHSKYLLLFRKDGSLRVVITSANLIESDWGTVENYLFVQDFPPATPGQDTVKLRKGERAGESFPDVLLEVLWSTAVEEGLQKLRSAKIKTPFPTACRSRVSRSSEMRNPLAEKWDWRRATALLVPSLPGKWHGWDQATRSGQMRLLRAVELLGASLDPVSEEEKKRTNIVTTIEEDKLFLEILTASMGRITPRWLLRFRLCAGGRRWGLGEWLDQVDDTVPIPDEKNTELIFPTFKTMCENKEARRGRGLFQSGVLGAFEEEAPRDGHLYARFEKSQWTVDHTYKDDSGYSTRLEGQ